MSDNVGARVRCLVGRSRAQLRLRDFVLHADRLNKAVEREDLARRYLHGEGIEIGALTAPMRVPPGVVVRHVDRMGRAELIAAEGQSLTQIGLDPQDIPEIDIVDDAARLERIPGRSQDFVIAHHVIEHLADPIGALHAIVRVLRVGGVGLLTLPDPRYTFDARRPRTTVEHVLRDHAEGPGWSRSGHHEEWARSIEGVPEERVAARVAQFAAMDARHHFHVWELRDFLALVLASGIAAEIVHAQAYLEEFAVVLRPNDASQASEVP